jgi:hypothetical protein
MAEGFSSIGFPSEWGVYIAAPYSAYDLKILQSSCEDFAKAKLFTFRDGKLGKEMALALVTTA